MQRLFKAHEINLLEQTVTIPVAATPRLVLIDRGRAQEYTLPEFGVASIVTQDGRIVRLRFEEQEKF